MRRRISFVVALASCAPAAAPVPVAPAPPAAPARTPAPAPAPAHRAGPAAWLGILTESAPAIVSRIVPGAPADKAGVQLGDEVVSIDGQPIANAKEVVQHAQLLAPNQRTAMVVKRRGATVALAVVPEVRPDVAAVQAAMIGKPAPAFSLPALAGGAPIALGAGQPTIVEFWATWCGPCAITAPHLEELAQHNAALRVIGISGEDAADVATFLARHKVTYTLALDPDDRATRDYLIQGVPTVFVIDKAGVIRFAAVGVPDFAQLDAAVAAVLR